MGYKGFLNGFWLKASMLLLMVIDHIYQFSGSPKELYSAHAAARVVAPVFVYLVAQSMVYTRSRERYILRLFAFAAVMSVGNIILMLVTKINIPNNIFLSFAISALIIYLTGKLKGAENRHVYAALTAGAAVLSFYCEGGFLMPMCALIFYYFRGNKPFMYAAYVLSSGLPFLLTYTLTGVLQTQFYMVLGVIPIMLYNGRRGPGSAFAKYFFYVFYPLHIWAIVLVRFYFSR